IPHITDSRPPSPYGGANQFFSLQNGGNPDQGLFFNNNGNVSGVVFEGGQWWLAFNSGNDIFTGDPIPGSGTDFTGTNPGNQVSFSDYFIPGIYPILGAFYDMTIIVLAFQPSSGGGGSSDSFMLIDQGAILGANTTGLALASANRGLVQSIGAGVFRDLNDRLFRRRAGIKPGTSGASVANLPQGDSAFSPKGGKSLEDEFGMQVRLEDMAAFRHSEVFAEFDYGYYNQDPLSGLNGYKTDTYAGTVGYEYRFNEDFAVGGAYSYLDSQAKLDGNAGRTDLDGHLLSAYASGGRGNFWADALYSYGSFDMSTSRATFIGPRARGNTDANLHNLAFNVGYTQALGSEWTLTPYGSLDYLSAQVDGYTESGNTRANLRYDDDSFDSLIGRLGVSLSRSRTLGTSAMITGQVRAAYAHEFENSGGGLSATLDRSPFTLVTGGSGRSVGSYTATSSDAQPGKDWLELGAGVRVDFAGRWNLTVDYNGTFLRDNAEAHQIATRLGVEW
ncbi:MAG: autotransporter outer membrane beta-barrel domain-containing protein, partial [Verrucomicrobiales bacterium]